MIISLPGAAALLSKKIKNKTNNVFEGGKPRKALNGNHSLVVNRAENFNSHCFTRAHDPKRLSLMYALRISDRCKQLF